MNWKAIYNDGTFLNQFDNETEHLFKDINQDVLIEFEVSDNNNKVTLSLSDGKFVMNGVELFVDGLHNTDFENRLIYFRRVTLNIGTRNVSENKTVKTFIGYQFTDDEGNNKKVILECGNNCFVIHKD